MTTADGARFHWEIKDDLVQRIETGLQNSVGILADMELEFEPHSTDGPDEAMSVTAVIGFDGEYRGVLSLHCPEAIALRIAEGMLGIKPEDIDDDVRDAVGEVVNILGGEVKSFLSPGGLEVALSTPEVFYGNDEFPGHLRHNPESLFCAYRHSGARFLVGVRVHAQR